MSLVRTVLKATWPFLWTVVKRFNKDQGSVLFEVVGQRRGGILTLSALGAVWAASNGVEAVRLGLDRACDVDDARHVALGRLISIGVALTGFGCSRCSAP